MIKHYAVLAVLLRSVVIAAAATSPAARQLASTVGGRSDPEVQTVHARKSFSKFIQQTVQVQTYHALTFACSTGSLRYLLLLSHHSDSRAFSC